mgnify:CR=1 FL=1|jgi:hypothetical protein
MLRLTHVGSFTNAEEGEVGEEQPFDLLISVVAAPTTYSELIEVSYQPPTSIPPALLTSAGYACLGIGLQPSRCSSGSAIDGPTATCRDGPTIMQERG